MEKEKEIMQEYIERLIRCGMPPHDALRLLKSMIRDFGYEALEELTRSMEVDCYGMD